MWAATQVDQRATPETGRVHDTHTHTHKLYSIQTDTHHFLLPVDGRGRRGNLLVQDATLELVVLEQEETLC